MSWRRPSSTFKYNPLPILSSGDKNVSKFSEKLKALSTGLRKTLKAVKIPLVSCQLDVTSHRTIKTFSAVSWCVSPVPTTPILV
jgi:hypothetical protein